MADDSYDFVVLGSSVLAGLIAGQLAAAHGKRVFLVREPFSPFRLQRRIDLSIAPVTRPETLTLLKRSAAELVRIAAGLGQGLCPACRSAVHRRDAARARRRSAISASWR